MIFNCTSKKINSKNLRMFFFSFIAFKDCAGIVFTHGVCLGRQAGDVKI